MIRYLSMWLRSRDVLPLLSLREPDFMRVCLDTYLRGEGGRNAENAPFPCIPALLRRRLTALPITALRLGSEDCARCLPTVAEIELILNLCIHKGITLELVLPVISESMFPIIESIVAMVKVQPDMLLVVNDIGTLRYAMMQGVSRVALGRLMWKQKRLARISSQELQILDKNVLEEYKTLEVPTWSRDLGIAEYEFDLTPQGIAVDVDDGHLAFHLPWCVVAFGRTCFAGALHQETSEKFKLGLPCRKECDTFAEIFESPHWPGPLVRHGQFVLAQAGLCDFSWFDLRCAHKVVIDGTRAPLQDSASDLSM